MEVILDVSRKAQRFHIEMNVTNLQNDYFHNLEQALLVMIYVSYLPLMGIHSFTQLIRRALKKSTILQVMTTILSKEISAKK